jgi:hypothetical protein|tara:strand:- start:250 stop:459 length:210 start_codon:yes stop_codon:yes gene_type:complete
MFHPTLFEYHVICGTPPILPEVDGVLYFLLFFTALGFVTEKRNNSGWSFSAFGVVKHVVGDVVVCNTLQ